MALINCPECKKEVPDAAPSCPNCGVPIAGAKKEKAAGGQLTTIQTTGKKLKIHSLLSALLVIMGFLGTLVVMCGMEQGGKCVMVPVTLFIIGFVWCVIARFKIWCHHK